MANLLYFNPGCELEVAHGSASYNLQKHPRILENDLSTLPMFFSRPGDYVASATRDQAFIDFWRDIYPCHFVTLSSKELRGIQFGSFVPWGISPRVLSLVEHLKFSPEYLNSPVAAFTPNHRKLFSRETSAWFFSQIIQRYPMPGVFPLGSQQPVIVSSASDAKVFFDKSNHMQTQGTVFKAIYGSSGRGVRILRNNDYSDNIHRWVSSMIQQQGALECEPFFNKISDFSMHYQIEGGKARYVGISRFNTAVNGAYQSSDVSHGMDAHLAGEITADSLSSIHLKILNNSIYTRLYEGPLGIDCMLYDDCGVTKVNPCIEINCRHSMGRLAMEISGLVATNSKATYHVYQKNNPLPQFAQKATFSNGKLVSGFLPLTPSDTQMFAAGILATDHIA